MEIITGIISSISTTIIIGGIIYFLKDWLLARLKISLQKEHSKFLEELKWEQKVREQAEKVAEYLAIAQQLKNTSSEDDYIKANQLSWELAMWLPEDIYKKTVEAIASPSDTANKLTAVINVRKLLLDNKAGRLSSDDIAHHAPNIGK